MIIRRKYKNFEVEVEANSIKESFPILSQCDEVLRNTRCGDKECRSEQVSFVCRENAGNKFYELRCDVCGRTLSFGQKKGEATIYPRRKAHKEHPLVKAGKAKAGDYLECGGWERFQRSQDDE